MNKTTLVVGTITKRNFSSGGVTFDPSKVVKRVLKMNNGLDIPQVGFGTYSIKKPEQIRWALQYGFRHFDTGAFYMNEGIIASEIKKFEAEQGVRRSDIFVASKIPPKEQGIEKTRIAVEKSIKALGDLEYIDMMLLTFPGTAGVDPKDEKNIENRHDAWKVLEEFVLKGTIKSIGVANFKPRHLEKLLEIAWVKPVVNQIELHPLYIEHDTVDLCKQNDILVEAYSPLAQFNKKVIENEALQRISAAHGYTISQTMLTYLLNKGYVILPRSSKEDHIASNI